MSLQEDIDIIKKQEDCLRFTAFGEENAWQLGSMMRQAALDASFALVIDITVYRRQLFYSALPGTAADNMNWVRRKRNLVTALSKSSYRVGRELALKGQDLEKDRGLSHADHAAHGGSFPIYIIGTGVVGTITVSGIPQRDDHAFVVDRIAMFLKCDCPRLPAEIE